MAELLNKFEFISGKGGSIQVLNKNCIYNKCLVIKYKCSSCLSVLSINRTLFTVTKEPTLHFGHEELTNRRIAVLKAAEYMKDLSKTETKNAIRAIYDKCLKMLTDQKFYEIFNNETIKNEMTIPRNESVRDD